MKSAKKTVAMRKHKNGVAKTQGAVAIIRPLTASSLKDVLWETLNDIKTEQMLPSRGDSIAGQAREILRTVKTQLQISGQSKRPIPPEIIEFSERR
jgi:hypothetical protein